jgi:hypothetical protein
MCIKTDESIYNQSNEPVDSDAIPLTNEQLDEFSIILHEALCKYLTTQEVSAIEIEVRFNPISKALMNQPISSVRIGCNPGSLDERCRDVGGHWGHR